MKYIYNFKLERDQYEDFLIIEYINEKKNAVWTLDHLLNIDNSNEIIMRAKYWLKENHPELMI